MMKKLILISGITVMVFWTSVALAIPWTMNAYNNFQDQSAEYLIDNDNNGVLSDGDFLRGIFVIDEITSPNYFEFGTPELTGFFEIMVESRTQLPLTATQIWTGNDNQYGHSVGDSFTSDLYSYSFTTSSDFEAEYGTGAMLAVFVDDTPDYQAYGAGSSIATGVDNAKDGQLYWTFGLGDTGEWTFDAAPEDLAIFEYASSTEQIASTQVGLNLLSNPVGPELVQDVNFQNDLNQLVQVDLRANITLYGIGDLVTEFDLKDKVDGALHPVPEPSTMILLGAGLLGLAVTRRKMNN